MDGDGRTGVEGMDVAYVAELARLKLTDAEIRGFQSQLGQVMDYVRQIRRLDLAGIEPTSHASPVANVFRADAVAPGLDRDAVLANAPASADGQFLVPKILE